MRLLAIALILGLASVVSADNAKRTPKGRESAQPLPVTLYKNTTPVNSVTTGEIDGQSYTMPANTLSDDGQKLVIFAAWNKAANGNTVGQKLIVANTTVANNATGTASVGTDIIMNAVRVNSTTLRYFISFISSTGGGTMTALRGTISGVNFAAPIVIKTTISGAVANGDTTALFLRVERWP